MTRLKRSKSPISYMTKCIVAYTLFKDGVMDKTPLDLHIMSPWWIRLHKAYKTLTLGHYFLLTSLGPSDKSKPHRNSKMTTNNVWFSINLLSDSLSTPTPTEDRIHGLYFTSLLELNLSVIYLFSVPFSYRTNLLILISESTFI